MDSREPLRPAEFCLAGRLWSVLDWRFAKGEHTVKYIQTQAEHHKRISFADELKKFLVVHGIEE